MAAALLGLMAALLVASSRHKRLTNDEYPNLSYGLRFIAQGPSAAPFGQRMPLLALYALPCYSVSCAKPLDHDGTLRLMVRLPSILFTLLLGLTIYSKAGEAFGSGAGLLALFLFVFNPSFLAHGKQVTSDVAVSWLMAGACFCFASYLRQPTRDRAVSVAVWSAAALLAKLTAILLLPIFVALAIVRRRALQAAAPEGGGRRLAGHLVYAIVLVLLLINAGYGFDGSGMLASNYHWESRTCARFSSWPVPLPLPRVFVQSFDYSSYLQENPEQARGANYVLGQLNREGRWYAFPVMLLLKTPLAFFMLLGLVAWRLWRGTAEDRSLLFELGLPALGVLLFFSLLVRPQLGIRYILPALPFLIVLASATTRTADGVRRRLLLGALVGWYALSTLSYHPHYIPYFNELIGRRMNAYRYLADSNLDWEDRAYFIQQYQKRHPERRLVFEPRVPQAGWIVVSANALTGIVDAERFRWLREGFEPVDHIGYSLLVYHVPAE
jgi:hypothetical protein